MHFARMWGFSAALLVCQGCAPATEIQAAPLADIQAQGKMMHITIGSSHFTAELADTPAAAELQHLLPLTLTMQDHLRNEKYANLPQRLSTNDSRPGRIEAGDIMLWQGQTLVIFYESFQSAYSYTRIGKLSPVHQLKTAVGTGTVDVRLAVK